MSNNDGNEPESSRKLFLGGLDYSTTEDGLRTHFDKYGKLVDVVVMRFPDTKRSRGFGFITFSTSAEADAAFEERPHNLDGASIETKRATPREEMNKGPGGSSETHRKLFIGGLNYSTTDDTLREYFSKFGELVDCVVMKFRDTKRSRGFGFVTYATLEQVDECQSNRPHTIDGTKVETKRATPRDDQGPGSGQTVTKCFLGGLKDGVSDENLQEYFSSYGNVVNVEQMTDKATGRKRGFGFVEFDDYDAVDKLMFKSSHMVNGYKIDVKKAISKNEMNMSRGGGGGGGGHGGMRGDHRGGPRGGQAPAPWGQDDGGYGGGYGNGGGYGQGGGGGYGGPGPRGGNMGGGGGGYGGGNSWGGPQGGNGGGNVAPWSQGGGQGGQGGYGGNDAWGDSGSGNNSWNDNSGGWGNDGGYSTGNQGYGPPQGGGGYGGGNSGGYGGGPNRGGPMGQGGPSGGGGGPMRGGNYGEKPGYRSAPYSVGARGGGAGGYSQRGGGSGGGRW